MATLPTILVDSTDGAASDSACSGAGPATALSGTAATTTGDGLTVTVTSEVAEGGLSGVSTTGDHVVYVQDSTAGARNFGKITSKTDTAGERSVGVSDAFGVSLSSQTWAIGGVRATIAGTNSKKLFDNNASAGDAMPGWIIQMQDGHSETSISAVIQFRRAGDGTSGPIILQGESGAATMPILRFTHAGSGILLSGATSDHCWLRDFEIQSSQVTKTSVYGIEIAASDYNLIKGMKLADATYNLGRGIYVSSSCLSPQIVNCEIANCTDDAIGGASLFSAVGMKIIFCDIHDNTGLGIDLNVNASTQAYLIWGNIIDTNAGGGIYSSSNATSLSIVGSPAIIQNTFYANTGDAIQLVQARSWNSAQIANNIFKDNTGYGINPSSTYNTDAELQANLTRIYNNCFHNNTSGPYPGTITTLVSENEITTDPTFTDAPNRDFTVGANMKALGAPTDNVGLSSNRSYVDIGAVSRQEPAGGGGGGGALIDGGLVSP